MRNEMQESKTIAHICHADRVVRMKELVTLIGLSRSTIYDRLNPKSKRFDPTFPKPIQLGASSIGWKMGAVLAWIAALPQADHITVR